MAKSDSKKRNSASTSALGMVGGAAAGAAAGSLVGPLGAAVGAVVGGVTGANAPTIAKQMPTVSGMPKLTAKAKKATVRGKSAGRKSGTSKTGGRKAGKPTAKAAKRSTGKRKK